MANLTSMDVIEDFRHAYQRRHKHLLSHVFKLAGVMLGIIFFILFFLIMFGGATSSPGRFIATLFDILLVFAVPYGMIWFYGNWIQENAELVEAEIISREPSVSEVLAKMFEFAGELVAPHLPTGTINYRFEYQGKTYEAKQMVFDDDEVALDSEGKGRVLVASLNPKFTNALLVGNDFSVTKPE